MALYEIHVSPTGDDPEGTELLHEVQRTLDVPGLTGVKTTRVYRVEGDIDDGQAASLAQELFTDPVTQVAEINPPTSSTSTTVEVGYKPGVMNPAAASVVKAATDKGVAAIGADVSTSYFFSGEITPQQRDEVVGRLLVNPTVQRVVTERPTTLLFEGSVGPVNVVPIREAGTEQLLGLSKDKLFLDSTEMGVIKSHFRQLDRDPTDAELEIIAARWSEHCGHKTFSAKVVVDGEVKQPLFERIKDAAYAVGGNMIVSAFEDNSGVISFYEGQAICGKVETHNSPSAIEPYGGAMTGSGGVFRDIMGTGQGAETIISTDMFCFAPPEVNESVIPLGVLHPDYVLPPGTLRPDYLHRRVVDGVRDYGNRMGIPTGNGSVHYHPDFRAKPTVIVGAYGILPESRAQKGEPLVGDLVVILGGRTGRDGIHGATFSSGEMTDRTANVNSSAVQIGNAIEEKRTFDALLEARDMDLIRALTDCGAAGFSSAIGEIGENIGVTVDISKAPLKYPGLAPWEIWLSESQERMVAAISPDNTAAFLEICAKYNVEAVVIGEFDGSHTLTVNYGDQNVAELDYEFLTNGLPQRTMQAHWEAPEIEENHPAEPETEVEWVARLKAVLSHGNVCSKEPIVRQYDHGVQGGNVVSPYGGVDQSGPNDALVIRPILGKPYGMVQSHGMNPILNRLDPYRGTVWAITEAAANYVAAGGNLREAAAVGNYIWPFPDEEAMGSLDRSVDAAVDMMHLLKLPVISGKDSLSSTYRGSDGQVIKIPPVYTMSIFGRIPDVEKTMTTNLKQAGSTLVLVGKPSEEMGGSVYHDVSGGSSGYQPEIDTSTLPSVFDTMHQAIVSGKVSACHDISEGGLAAAVSEMCFGSIYGAKLNVGDIFHDQKLFSETAGCFVVEVESKEVAQTLFGSVPFQVIGVTTDEPELEVRSSTGQRLFRAPINELKQAWQAPMQELFHS